MNTQAVSLPLRVYSLARTLIECDEKTDVQGAQRTSLRRVSKNTTKPSVSEDAGNWNSNTVLVGESGGITALRIN